MIYVINYVINCVIFILDIPGLAIFTLPHPLYHCPHGGTHQCIPVGKVQQLNHFFSIGVWVLPACPGPCRIYAAMVVIPQKRAGRAFQYVVPIFIDAQVLRNEISGLHAQCAGNPFDVMGIENGTGRFAAVRASQAIHFGKNRFMHGVKLLVE